MHDKWLVKGRMWFAVLRLQCFWSRRSPIRMCNEQEGVVDAGCILYIFGVPCTVNDLLDRMD